MKNNKYYSFPPKRKEIKTDAKTKGVLYWLSVCRALAVSRCSKHLS
jgi:hypothetical protein